MKNIIFLLNIFVLILGSGCSSVVDTNKTTEFPLPMISTTDSIAEVQIMEPITGEGCARQWFGFYNQGDNKFLNTTGDEPKTPIDRAKAAALFNAIRVANAKGLSADIVVTPVWSIATSYPLTLPLGVHDVCAQVKGFRGVVKGFKSADTITSPGVKKNTESKFDLNIRASRD